MARGDPSTTDLGRNYHAAPTSPGAHADRTGGTHLCRAPPLIPPRIDPTPIFEAFRGSHATELLTAAVAHLEVFGLLAGGPLAFDELRVRLGLAERPANVLVTALRALGLLERGRRRAARADRPGSRAPDAGRRVRRQRVHRAGGREPRRAGDGREAPDEPARRGRGRARAGRRSSSERGSSRRWSARRRPAA